jgi:tetratricopeptide (TPR) repeat protein
MLHVHQVPRGEAFNVVTQGAGTPSRMPITLSGIIPMLSDTYHPRPETGPDLAPRPGETVVLTAQGGTGKTELAAEFAHARLRDVEVLAWVTATGRDAILSGFAQAANAVGAADLSLGAEAAAARFVAWLSRTRRSWALIIDDLRDAADLDGLWPAGPAGQVVMTTRLPAPAIQGAFGLAGGLRIVPVGGFSPREAMSYLIGRLIDHPDQRIEALDLGEDLGALPLSMAQAAAVMSVDELGCREYRARLGERREHMLDVADVPDTVLAAWSLAAEAADELAPAGLAWPTLALAAVLGAHGIPGAVLTCPAACGYVTGRPSMSGQGSVRAALTNLARVSLVSIDLASPVRTVRMHPSVRAAVLAYLTQADLEQVVRATADALIQVWPESGAVAAAPLAAAAFQAAALQAEQLEALELQATLRDCAAAVRSALGAAALGGAVGADRALWQPEVHPLLFRQGSSLEDSGLTESAIVYWQSVVATGTQLLGPGDETTVMARDRLAAGYEAAGRHGDALAMFQQALAEREGGKGAEHPDTIAARGRLAHAFASAGRPAEAVELYEQTTVEAGRRLGPVHPVTLSARASLAEAYQAAARGKDSIAAFGQLADDAERLLGPGHPVTRSARAGLAAAYLANAMPREAVEQYKRVLADTEAQRGRDHPETIAARASLAAATLRAGKPRRGRLIVSLDTEVDCVPL